MTKEELEKRMDELDDAIYELWDSVTDDESWKRYKESPLHAEYRKLSQQYRKIRDYKLVEKVPSYGNHMALKKFVDSCLGRGFCNSDGFGNYATKEMMSDVEVYPSDIIAGVYRDDFDYVVWFNR